MGYTHSHRCWAGIAPVRGVETHQRWHAARALRSAPVQVTLLDRAEHHLFPPLLYQCATGILSEGRIAYPLRELLHKQRNVEFFLAEVTGIDAGQRRVLARRPLGEQVEF